MSETDAVTTNNAVGEENTQNNKVSKGRKSKSPRVSTLDRTREEGEAIAKDLGPEVQGRRLTRSAAKGVTATPPPPAKKERKSTKGRGRPKRNATAVADESGDSHDDKSETSVAENEEATKMDTDQQKSEENEANSHEEEAANNNAETSKEEATSEVTENGAKEDSVDAPTSEDEKKEETNQNNTEEKSEKESSGTIEADKPAE